MTRLGCILDGLVAVNVKGVTKARLAAGGESVKLRRRIFHVVFLLNVKLTGERHEPRAGTGILRAVGSLNLFHMARRPVRDGQLKRTEHSHEARDRAVQIFADGELK